MIRVTLHLAFDRRGRRLHGRFEARLEGHSEILCISREPLLAASRALLAKGIDPKTPIVTRHAGADFDAMISTIGAAAKWRVEEGNTVSPTFRRWMAYPAPRGQSPTRVLRVAGTCPGAPSDNQALVAMSEGQTLHLQHREGRPRWSLNNGQSVALGGAAITTNAPSRRPATLCSPTCRVSLGEYDER